MPERALIMEFHEKLQELRKQRGLTQEELAEALYVSRTAVSKWESGRGYPSIDSLKAISAFFAVTIDALLSGSEVITIAEEDNKQKELHFRDLIFGLLDCSISLLFVLPFFGQKIGETVHAVSLLSLTTIEPYLKGAYIAVVIAMTAWGILTLALQNWRHMLWGKYRHSLSLFLNAAGTLLFTISPQPYAAAFLFVFLAIKVLFLIKWH